MKATFADRVSKLGAQLMNEAERNRHYVDRDFACDLEQTGPAVGAGPACCNTKAETYTPGPDDEQHVMVMLNLHRICVPERGEMVLETPQMTLCRIIAERDSLRRRLNALKDAAREL